MTECLNKKKNQGYLDYMSISKIFSHFAIHILTSALNAIEYYIYKQICKSYFFKQELWFSIIAIIKTLQYTYLH